ncbi:MAG: M48 family metalloprotease, partial [Pseudomonadota bacterium]
LTRPRTGHWVAMALAMAVLAVPPAFLLGAAILAVAGWPSIPVLVVAALLALMGVFLWPRPAPLPDRMLRRADLPATFAMLDTISAAMAAPQITALSIEEEANAYVGQIRGEVLLGLGALLWQAATPAERHAILAHEIGHLVNGDPRRGGIIWRARQVVDRWHGPIVPDNGGGGGIAFELVQVPLALALEVLDALLTRLTYPESQRAEYLADALAARVAGSGAMVSAMNLLSRAPLLEARFNRLHGPAAPEGAACVDWVAKALVDPPEAAARRIAQEMAAELHTVDTSHPPTAHRIAFLRALDLPPADLPTTDEAAFAAEWTPHLDRIGDRWRRAATVQ